MKALNCFTTRGGYSFFPVVLTLYSYGLAMPEICAFSVFSWREKVTV